MSSHPSYSRHEDSRYPRTAVAEMTRQTMPIDDDTYAPSIPNEEMSP